MRTFAALSTKVGNTNEAEPVADRDHFLKTDYSSSYELIFLPVLIGLLTRTYA